VSDRSNSGNSTVLVAVLVGLVGIAIGWLVRDWRATELDGATRVAAATGPGSSAAPVGSAAGLAAECSAWAKKVCDAAGAEAEGCARVRKAAQVLPAKACRAALAEVPVTLARLAQAASTCDQLVAKLCADIGKDSETCTMVTERTKGFPASQCEDMLENYEVVIAELRKMEEQNAPLSAEKAARQAAGEGPSFGPADAKVAIVEYSDFECPYCTKAAAAVTQLKERYGTVVRVVFRHYPLPMHRNAMLAAEASLAAHAQGKFWPYHDLLFENSRTLDRKSLESYAKQVGLDMGAFKKALDDHRYADQVKADMKLGAEIGVSGTPTMIVGTKRVTDPTNFAVLARLVEAELAAAGVAVPKAD